MPPRYRLGLPAWGFPGWGNRYFTDKPSRLASYASVFTTVEGNTTFYRTPDAQSVDAWLHAVAGTDFRFCFKLPRPVTHERRADMRELDRFLAAIEPLREYLGPLLVQFPKTVGPAQLADIEPVFARLAGEFSFVVEVRHPDFFADPTRLEPALDRHAAGRVVLDSRPLYQGNRSHPDVVRALHQKPELPVLPQVYNDLAFIRLILHPDLGSNERYIDEWAQHIKHHIDSGVETYMMIHCPNNLHCPLLAEQFHAALAGRFEPALENLPPWPVPQQRDLL